MPIEEFVSRLSLPHLSILLLLGLALFGGTLGGRLFSRWRIPQVVAYVLVGIVFGRMGLNIVDDRVIEMLQPFNTFALGLIGFKIGGELKKQTLLKYGRQFLAILLAEGVTAFLLVTAFVALTGSLFIHDSATVWSLALLLGAIASATAPAATTDVLWEYKTRGPLTTTILGIVALDDGLALLLFALAASVASSLVGSSGAGLVSLLLHPLLEMAGAIFTGAVTGWILALVIKKLVDEEKILALSLGAVLLMLGIAITVEMDILTSSMAMGVMITNIAPRKSHEIFGLIDKFAPPVYVLFFVLFGAKMDFSRLTPVIAAVVAAYLIGRTTGKMAGAYLGGWLSGAAESVRKYLPLCLFSQAGVAIGLSILASQRFPGEIGDAIVLIITTSTFVVQIIGPPMVRIAVTRAGEVGLNITEEDLIKKTKARDVMTTDLPAIQENTPLQRVLTILSEHANLFYPVVDESMRLIGIITIDNVKNTFITLGFHEFLLAHDLMEPVVATADPEMPMNEVKERMLQHRLEYLPVVSGDNRIEGFLESRTIQRLISQRIDEIQKKGDRLG